MKRVINEMKALKLYYGLGILFLLVSTGLGFYFPYLTQQIIDKVIRAGQLELFGYLGMMMLAATFTRAITGYLKEVFFDLGGVNLAAGLRQKLFDHIQGLSYDFFDEKNTGELMSRVKEDVDNIWRGTSFGLFLSVEMIVTVVFALVLMLRIHLGLTLLILPVLPVLGFLTICLNKENGKIYEKISEQTATMNTTASEDIAGIRMVKSFAREKHEIEKFLKNNEEYYTLNYRQARVMAKYFPPIEFITALLPIVLIVAGGNYIIKGDLTIGQVVEFSTYASMATWPMHAIGWIANLMAQAGSSAKKVDEIFAYHSKIENPKDGKKDISIRGDIRFENVGLKLDDVWLLRNITFEVKSGQTLAIMGATGSGKSLITKLLARFYDVTEGVITLDGIPIQEYDLYFLRKQLSFVLQNVFLFSESIAENISLGQEKPIPQRELENVAKNAMAHDFIKNMELSYETVVGEKGIGLSGGQKQRISIARALARKSPVLVLDDSTSALDMETEKNIQKTIESLENTTKIIVAHRISAVKQADEILMIAGGGIVERGKHQDLMEQKGHYYETFQEQNEFLVG